MAPEYGLESRVICFHLTYDLVHALICHCKTYDHGHIGVCRKHGMLFLHSLHYIVELCDDRLSLGHAPGINDIDCCNDHECILGKTAFPDLVINSLYLRKILFGVL